MEGVELRVTNGGCMIMSEVCFCIMSILCYIIGMPLYVHELIQFLVHTISSYQLQISDLLKCNCAVLHT